jgi:hypothetical protein
VFIPTTQLLYLKRAIFDISYPKIIIGKVKIKDTIKIMVDSIPENPRYLKAFVRSRYTRYIVSISRLTCITQRIISIKDISANVNITNFLI